MKLVTGTQKAHRRQSSEIGSRLQTEDVQHRRGRLVLQLGRILDDKRPHARSHQNGNVLLAVDRIADRRSLNWAAAVEAPDLVQGPGVIGRERAAVMTKEDQIAGGASAPARFG